MSVFSFFEEVYHAGKILFRGLSTLAKDIEGQYYPPRKRDEKPVEFDWDYDESDEEASIEEYEEKLEQSKIPDQPKEPEVINLDEQDIESTAVRTYSSGSPASRIADWDGSASGAGHPPRTIHDLFECAARSQGIEINENEGRQEHSSNDEPDASAEQIDTDRKDTSSMESNNADADGSDSNSSSLDSDSSSDTDMDMDADFDGDSGGSFDGGGGDGSSDFGID